MYKLIKLHLVMVHSVQLGVILAQVLPSVCEVIKTFYNTFIASYLPLRHVYMKSRNIKRSFLY